MNRLVIVGGGIAGLAAAYYAKKTDPKADLTVLESAARWGGKIMTERVGSKHGVFIIEGGPDTFLATKPYATELCRELGMRDRLHGTNPEQRNTYVLRRDQLLPLPDGLAMMIPTNVNAILHTRLISWLGKVRMGLDLVMPPKPVDGDESLGAFVRRRLGREAYEAIIEPLMSGIYAGDGDALSLASTFPYLSELEQQYGSLGRGALKMRRLGNGNPVQGSRSAFLTPTTGLVEIVERLIDSLRSAGVSLRLHAHTKWVQQGGSDPWTVALDSGETLPADGVIVATPAYAAARLLSRLDRELASDLEGIPYASTATVSLAYKEGDVPRPLDGYGYVIPRREGRRALACTWTSTKFPHRAPAGHALIRVFIGRAGEAEPASENELLAVAKEELRRTLGVTAAPILSRVSVWPRAMPQYNLGHPECVRRIEVALHEYPGLAIAGNAYHGIGIPDCIHSGELAAKRVLRDLQLSSETLAPASAEAGIPADH